jgi:hypothetical protein
MNAMYGIADKVSTMLSAGRQPTDSAALKYLIKGKPDTPEDTAAAVTPLVLP